MKIAEDEQISWFSNKPILFCRATLLHTHPSRQAAKCHPLDRIKLTVLSVGGTLFNRVKGTAMKQILHKSTKTIKEIKQFFVKSPSEGVLSAFKFLNYYLLINGFSDRFTVNVLQPMTVTVDIYAQKATITWNDYIVLDLNTISLVRKSSISSKHFDIRMAIFLVYKREINRTLTRKAWHL